MSTWYQRYPVARFDEAHLARVIGCSDSGDGAGSNGRQSGVDDWLVVTSISVPVAVVFGRHLESLGVSTRLWLIAFRNCSSEYAPLSYISMHDLIRTSF